MREQNKNQKNIESLLILLESKDDKVRIEARESLVFMKEKAVPSLIFALGNSPIHKVRWEAAKALGAIGNVKAIPALVKALNDPESDVAWLAAEALKNFRKAAWPELLRALVSQGTDSVLLRHGAHHIFRKQKEDGFNFLLTDLRTALASNSVPESTPLAASKFLKSMSEQPEYESNK